jgi:hypothetical protein
MSMSVWQIPLVTLVVARALHLERLDLERACRPAENRGSNTTQMPIARTGYRSLPRGFSLQGLDSTVALCGATHG